jgi:predicted O-linked N-acetylglucosamine transferase (SPINDLY family)
MDNFTPLLQKKVAKIYAESVAGHLLRREPANRRKAINKEKLRIAYLSADFYAHATMQLFGGVLANHNSEFFEVFLYSFSPEKELEVSQTVHNKCTCLRHINKLSDVEAANLIVADEIDILVDLKGYTQGSRPGITAQKPAPIVVSWLGYPGTLGHVRMADYIIGDKVVTPAEHMAHFSEIIAQLPHCYQPNNDRNIIGSRPTRNEVGLPDTGFVFCNFNHIYKTTPDRFAVWARLLEAVPGSVLWQLAPKDAAAIANMRGELLAHGIDPERMIIAPAMKFEEHLGRLQLADLALDTFPCTSHTTASDALWAGVPTVTQIGETFASRVAASLLQTLDMSELVTTNVDDYFSLALSLAKDADRLATLRERLRANRLTSPLFDTIRFTHDLESLYRRIWEQESRGVRAPIIT